MLGASVVIPTCDRPDRLARTLLALASQDAASFEVVVVDDGSVVRASDVISDLSLPFSCRTFWQAGEGFRAGRARNTGILMAESDIILLLDDDMLAPPGLVDAHVAFHATREDVVAIGFRSRLAPADWQASAPGCEPVTGGRTDPRLEFVGGSTWRDVPWAYFSSSHASVRRSALCQAGLFDERFVGWGFEDTELAYRMHGIGLRFEAFAGPNAIHLEDPAWDMAGFDDTLDLPPAKLAGFLRNREYFLGKYDHDPQLVKLLRKTSLMEARSRARLKPAIPSVDIVTSAFSLWTPYKEGDEVAALPDLPVEFTAQADSPSMMDDLEHYLGLPQGTFEHRRFRLPNWATTLLATPLVVLAGLVIVLSLVVTGRYGRIVRRRA